MSLLADHNMPFAAALAVMVLLALVQAIGLGGFALDADVDDPGAADGMASIIGIGKVPFLIWLALFLLLFAAIGVSVQALAESLTGNPLYVWLGAVIAGGAALPATGVLVRPLAAILPGDETTAVSLDSLVGRRGTVTTGVARSGSPARARVTDFHGHPHFVMVEPDNAGQVFEEGERVLLVRREGGTFRAIARGDHHLPRLGA